MNYLFHLPCFSDADGTLSTFETNDIQGFQIKRIITICDVPIGMERANHACMNATIILFVLSGTVRVSVEEDNCVTEYLLENNNTGLFISECSWIRAYEFSNDAILLGISNKEYRDCEYVSDYHIYKELIRNSKR